MYQPSFPKIFKDSQSSYVRIIETKSLKPMPLHYESDMFTAARRGIRDEKLF